MKLLSKSNLNVVVNYILSNKLAASKFFETMYIIVMFLPLQRLNSYSACVH